MTQWSFRLSAIYRCVCSINDIAHTPNRYHSFVMGNFNITEVAYRWELVDIFYDFRGQLDPNSLFKQQPNLGLGHLIVEVSR